MYKDLNPLLQPHPDTHDITVRTGVNAINGAISNLVLTAAFERPYNKLINGGMRKLLFESPSEQIAGVIQTTIEQLINNFEKRAHNVAVDASLNSTRNGYNVTVVYTASESGKQGTIKLELKK
jgi:phage baseplate assembly protein W